MLAGRLQGCCSAAKLQCCYYKLTAGQCSLSPCESHTALPTHVCLSGPSCSDISIKSHKINTSEQVNINKDLQFLYNVSIDADMQRRYRRPQKTLNPKCFAGDTISAQDTPRVLREVMQMLTLSHADSNEAPLPDHTPLIPPVGSSLYPTPGPSLHNTSQDMDAAPPRRLHRAVSGPAQGYNAQPLYSHRSHRYSADLELHSSRLAMPATSGLLSAEPTVHKGFAYHPVQQTSGDHSRAYRTSIDRNAVQQAQQQPLYDSHGSIGERQHADQQHSFDFARGGLAGSQPHR